MNVFQFFIEARIKNTVRVKQQFIQDYKQHSSYPTRFINDINNKWDTQKDLKVLFNKSFLVVGGTREGVDYYIFDMNEMESTSKNEIKFDVVVLSEIDIDDSINVVIKDIKEIFKNGKIKVLKNNFIYLYPFNNVADDIYATTHKIKARFENKKINIVEWIRILVFLFITGVTGYLIFLNPGGYEEKPVEIAIFATVLPILLSELILKFSPQLFKKHISINNLSDFIQQNPLDDRLFSRQEEIDITNPPEGSDSNE